MKKHLPIGVPVKKGVLKKFAKFTGKNLSYSLFFNKIADLRPEDCLAVNFSKFFIKSFFVEHLWWLLLNV